jgi:cell division protein FtsL
MLTERQEEWIILSQPEPVEEPVYFSAKPISKLRQKCFLLLILIFTSAMLIVAQNDQLVTTSYKLVEMKEHVAELEIENQSIRIDIAKLKSSERIADIATHQLGLVLPDVKYISTSL